jgi:hypothetical protein
VFARLLATLCLVLVCVPLSSAQSAVSQDAELVVYLRTGGNQPAGPLAQMKRELGALMHQAGYRVEWRSVDANRTQDADASLLAVLDLAGVCGIAPGYADAERAAKSYSSLATTTITDGQVLPFSSLNCGALTNSVSAALAKEAGARRDFLYGRAMARVVAHELYHVLMRTTEHGRSGVARSCFSGSDLLTERFEFEGTALARLRHRPDTVADVGAVGDESSDR